MLYGTLLIQMHNSNNNFDYFKVLVCIIDLVYPPSHHKIVIKDGKDENSDSGQESVSSN